MKIVKPAILASGMVGIPPVTGDLFTDARLYTAKLCSTCHGLDASSPFQPSYPKLAGQSSAYCP